MTNTSYNNTRNNSSRRTNLRNLVPQLIGHTTRTIIGTQPISGSILSIQNSLTSSISFVEIPQESITSLSPRHDLSPSHHSPTSLEDSLNLLPRSHCELLEALRPREEPLFASLHRSRQSNSSRLSLQIETSSSTHLPLEPPTSHPQSLRLRSHLTQSVEPHLYPRIQLIRRQQQV